MEVFDNFWMSARVSATMFGKLFGHAKSPAPSAATPAPTRSEQPGSAVPQTDAQPGTAQLTTTERQEYGFLREAVERYGLGKLTTPGVRELMSQPLADTQAQIRRVVDHPNFRTALHEMHDHHDDESEQLRQLTNLISDIKEFGRMGCVNDAFVSYLKNARNEPTNRAFVKKVFSHPDIYRAIRQYETHREALEHKHALDAAQNDFDARMAEVEADAFANPSTMLTYTDTRPQNWEGVRLRHVVHYRRIAGTMNDREKFVYLMAHAMRFFGELGQDEETVENEFALRVTSALYGGGTGEQEWELDRNYAGFKEDMLLEGAKKVFDPWPVEKYFNHGAKVIMDMHARSPENPLVKWGMQKLRPHSAGWATDR